jgi:serine/threonine protein phosphatase 1
MGTVQRFPINTAGRDYVVGDIHGCFDALCVEMDRVGFDPSTDRLFSVGDLVDRGPLSADAINWIGQDWFHAVRGNHEQMAIGVADGRHDLENYRQNGGAWFLDLHPDTQARMAEALDTLPLCIEVETSGGLVGIVHADIAGGDWAAFTDQLRMPRSNNHAKALAEVALWSRDRIRSMDRSVVTGLTWMFVGHTPVNYPIQLGNVWYIDTGCVFGRALTMTQFHDHKDIF